MSTTTSIKRPIETWKRLAHQSGSVEDAGECKSEPGQAGNFLRDSLEKSAPIHNDQDCGAIKSAKQTFMAPDRVIPRGTSCRTSGRESDMVLSISFCVRDAVAESN